MLQYIKRIFWISWLLVACQPAEPVQDLDLENTSWDVIVDSARNQTIHFMMWQGSPEINQYIQDFVRPNLKQRYNIDLKVVGGQGQEIVQLILGEKEANITQGQVDIVWINGETFFQLRQINGLWGPFVDKLPNAKFVDFSDPYIGIDFQQPIDYMECPWTVSQFALVYDSAKISTPPTSISELQSYVQQYPGTFTISNDFSGMTLLKSFLAEISGRPQGLNGPFNEEQYETWSDSLWSLINTLKPYFWKEGQTFPKEQTTMDQMFASGELWIGYGFGEGSVEDKVLQGLFPTTTRTYAWANGTIRNSNYLGIPYNSAKKAAAMVAINFFLSPEAQLKKMDPEGMNTNTVLDMDKLPLEWIQQFESVPKRKYGQSLEELEDKAIQEPDPKYMIRLYEDFRDEVIEK